MVGCRVEQSPNPNSRVVLEHERDALGMNKVRLDWRLTQQDFDSLRRAQRIFDDEWNFTTSDSPSRAANGDVDTNIAAAAHHMGTTRMHRDPKFGVVDETCRVHGVHISLCCGCVCIPYYRLGTTDSDDRCYGTPVGRFAKKFTGLA